jgi:hypothetical protein
MMFASAMNFLKRMKAPVIKSQDTIVKIAKTTSARRVNPDSDGKIRRMRQLVEHNRLI